MATIFSLQGTIFLLVLIGFLLKKINLITDEGQKNLNNLVIYVVLPCNILKAFMIHFTLNNFYACICILAISIGIQIVAVFYGKIVFHGEKTGRKKCLTYGILCSNAGFLGNPIAEGVFGGVGLMLASVYLIPQRIMMWSSGLAIFSGTNDKKETMRKVATHPCILACFIGLLCMIFGYRPPAPVYSTIAAIGSCNTALSMMVIGMILAQMDLKTMWDVTVVRFTIHRLLIIPLLVYLVCLLFHVSRLVTGVSVLLAAMPAGATTSILASKYDMEPEFATKLVVFSTLCSLISIGIWSSILT